jgi:hypothetical protein
MNKSFAFVGRESEITILEMLHAQRKHAVIVGPPGIGKTALLRQARQRFPFLLCEETSSLRRICDGLERELGWTHHKMNVIERKNRLLPYLARRATPVALDNVAATPPRVERFIAHLKDQIPVWIACRSDQPRDIGAVWQHLYQFTRVELEALSLSETSTLVEAAVDAGHVQADVRRHTRELHRMSEGIPRILEELLIELAHREYKIDSSFGLGLLDLDRRIHEIGLAVKAADGRRA